MTQERDDANDTVVTEQGIRHSLLALLDRSRPWALLPESMALMLAVARGDLGVPEARVRGQRRGALRTEAPPSADSIAILGLRGLITPRGTLMDELCGTGGGLEAFRANLDEAVNDADVGSIVLDIDSPGGLTDLVPETAAEIRDARQVKPVVAVANTLAASAAYYLAAQADEVVVTPSGFAGAIGVYTAHVDISGAEEKAGVRTTLVSAGRFKTETSPYAPLSEEAQEALQRMVDDVYGQFVADVALGRGDSPDVVRAGYGEGRVLGAERAVGAGVADSVEPLEQVLARLAGGQLPAPASAAGPAASTDVEVVAATAPSVAIRLSADDRRRLAGVLLVR